MCSLSKKEPIIDIDAVSKRKRSNESAAEEDSPHLKFKMSNSECNNNEFIFNNTDNATQLLHSNKKTPKRLEEWLDIFSHWSHSERITALDCLVSNDVCEVQQMRHLLSLIEPQLQRDFISHLPKELSLYVLSFLDPCDILNAAKTCRYWRILCEDNILWREKCREEGLLDDQDSFPKLFRRRLPTSTSSCINHSTPTPPMNESPPHQTSVPLSSHEDHVITCLQFNPNSNIIISGSDDNTLKVWSSLTGRCLRTLNGHTGGVWSSQLSPQNIIISGSTDRTLRVWNALNGQCLHVLYGHTSTVRCMALHGSYVVSGSRDATLRVWNIETGHCDHVLVGHLAAVRCVQFNGKLCVSGAYDFLVKVWDHTTETCLHTLDGHTNRVYSLQFDGIHIVSGSLDTSIRVWSADDGKLKHTLMGHQSLTSGMQLRNNILVSGNADSTVKVWDINTGQCLQTLSGSNKHQSAVTCLQFNSKFVITSSDDGTVKLWDLKTGEFIRNLISLPSGGSGGVVWRIRASQTKLVCAVGSRNGTEETKLLVLNFETPYSSLEYDKHPSLSSSSSLSSSCDFFNGSTATKFHDNDLPPGRSSPYKVAEFDEFEQFTMMAQSIGLKGRPIPVLVSGSVQTSNSATSSATSSYASTPQPGFVPTFGQDGQIGQEGQFSSMQPISSSSSTSFVSANPNENLKSANVNKDSVKIESPIRNLTDDETETETDPEDQPMQPDS
ncbi:hypothetical protein RDWZM_007504 [Blomia tropicalis]|uniref:F-box domain-containing protein n=1 Tax=Blomia tropicalis TaxID=40697 RepID=A0A9Q0M2Q8_BLOTA|nr:hypothetical protein RDWZM_007504 [Blomia tropicalis]